ncbi:hypothetical protein SynA18461_01954 [Synechococcus sp. A18-46.1]|nr:hypothetical protein SynA18461_01954 [Synechococcus sp. A18-46.1]
MICNDRSSKIWLKQKLAFASLLAIQILHVVSRSTAENALLNKISHTLHC